MKFFIDTANLDQIEEAQNLGVLDGVTTNPSLMAKEGITGKQNILDHYAKICKIVDGDVSAEVIATDYENMIIEGEELAAINPQIVIKLPMTHDGIKAAKYFSNKGTKTNVTLVFSAGQALLAAKAGATYVSPFLGRLDDISTDGLNLISEIREIYDNYNFQTQILAASIRHTMHIIDCAKIGADVITSPLSSISGLLNHPLMLKLLEGTIVNVPPKGGRKHPDQKFIEVNTENILFIAGGAFDGIDRHISRRLNLNVIGYKSAEHHPILSKNILKYINPKDLKEYGLIPEIIGRLPVVTYMDPLDKNTLLNILTKPKNALIKQYVKLFEFDGIKLEFNKSALDFIVDKAVDYGLGARGLRSLCEEVLNDAMFNLPGSETKKLVVTKKYASDQIARINLKKLKAAS